MEAEKRLFRENLSFGALAGHAQRSLSGKWGVSIGVLLLMTLAGILTNIILPGVVFGAYLQCAEEPNFLVARLLSQLAQRLGGFLISPLNVGAFCLFFCTIIRGETPSIGMIFRPFSQYGRYLWGYIRPSLFIFLWGLLFIIPGIVATLRYSMTCYIMLDHPEYSVKQAMTESCAITRGYKWRLFGYGLLLGLIGALVIVLTLGLGMFWFLPWSCAFYASIYESLRRGPEPTAAM